MTSKLLRACAIFAFSLIATESTLSADNPAQGPSSSKRHRLIVLTDMGADPDDEQTLVRLLLFAKQIDIEGIVRHAEACGRVLVVDEGRRSGGVSEAIFTAIVEHARPGIAMRRVVGEDTYIPLGPAANEVLPSEERILQAARTLLSAAIVPSN